MDVDSNFPVNACLVLRVSSRRYTPAHRAGGTRYTLESMFVPNGLWSHRNDRNTFVGTRFVGDDGIDNAASAPWGWSTINARYPISSVTCNSSSGEYYEINEFNGILNKFNSARVTGSSCISPYSSTTYSSQVNVARCQPRSFTWQISWQGNPYVNVGSNATYRLSLNNTSYSYLRLRLKVVTADNTTFYSTPKFISITYNCNGGITPKSNHISNSLNSMEIYPNPVQNTARIDLGEFDGKIDLELIELSTGRRIQTFESIAHSDKIDLSGIQKGIYVLMANHDGYQLQRQLVKL